MSGVIIDWSDGPAERDARVEVIRSAWHAAYPHIFTRSEVDAIFDGDVAADASWVGARLVDAGTLGARRDGVLVGLASLGLLRGGDAELAALYVRPEVQGTGVGRSLWDRALAELSGRGCARMEVWTLSRAPARRFYEARGCVLFAEGTFSAAGHVEPAVGYALDLERLASPGAGQSTPTR